MFLADLYIVANFPPTDVSNWAFYKSALFILSAFCLLGLDQVIVRHPNLIKPISCRFVINLLAVLGLVTIIATTFDFTPVSTKYLIFCTLLISLVTFVAACFRAQNRLIEAQLATNGWKPILLILMIFAIGGVDQWFTGALISIFVLTLPMLFAKKDISIKKRLQRPKEDINHLGFYFLLHSLTLVVAVHGEQFIITLFGYKEVSFIVFSHFVIFTPIAISVNGFLGFYLAPKIRRHERFDFSIYRTYKKRISTLSFSLSLISLAIGALIYVLFYEAKHLKLEAIIISSLFIMCLARGQYTFASVCLNVFATKQVLLKTALFNWITMGAYLLLLVIILKGVQGTIIQAQLIAVATGLHWLSRTYISNYFAKGAVNTYLLNEERRSETPCSY
ncbi:hypothetical protein [Thalassotalea fusca]